MDSDDEATSNRTVPDMTGNTSDIDDPIALFARIGYRTYEAWHRGEYAESLYEGFNLIALRRVAELRGEEPTGGRPARP
jgi:hypothetical protein